MDGWRMASLLVLPLHLTTPINPHLNSNRAPSIVLLDPILTRRIRITAVRNDAFEILLGEKAGNFSQGAKRHG